MPWNQLSGNMHGNLIYGSFTAFLRLFWPTQPL